MANNRMWLVCRSCSVAGADDSTFFLGKYYPSQGWYCNRDRERLSQLGADLDAWFDRHKHETLFGEEIALKRETDD